MRYRSWVAVAAVLSLLPCGSAAASAPIKGGRYAGLARRDGRALGRVTFTVSDSGRSLLPNARLDSSVESWVGYRVPCTSDTATWGLAGDGVFARSGGAALRIDRAGRFEFRDTLQAASEQRTLNLGGRFQHGGRRVRGSFEVIRNRADGTRCTSGRVQIAARFTGQRHLVKGTCNQRGTRTVARSRRARIFEQHYVDDTGGADRVAYGCLFATHRRFFVAFTEDPQYVGHFMLAGRFVGFSNSYCPTDCGTGVDVVDLSTGLARYNVDASPALDMDSDLVKDLVLSSRGNLAWITCQDRCEVDKLDGIAPVPLDAGKGINRTSLALTGSTLSWENGGVTKTATLQ